MCIIKLTIRTVGVRKPRVHWGISVMMEKMVVQDTGCSDPLTSVGSDCVRCSEGLKWFLLILFVFPHCTLAFSHVCTVNSFHHWVREQRTYIRIDNEKIKY